MGSKQGKKASQKNVNDHDHYGTDDDNICKKCGGYYDYSNYDTNNNYTDSNYINDENQDYNNYDDDSDHQYATRYDQGLGHYLHTEPAYDDSLLPYPNVKPLTLFERREYERANMIFPLDKSGVNLFKNTPARSNSSASNNQNQHSNNLNNFSSAQAPSAMQERQVRTRNTPRSSSIDTPALKAQQPQSTSTPRSYVG
jgi:hypothetical protein